MEAVEYKKEENEDWKKWKEELKNQPGNRAWRRKMKKLNKNLSTGRVE